jgi:isocitrate dehydrogenase (NAD+)
MKTVTLIPGDGIGPEVIQAVKTIFAAAQVPVVWEEHQAGQQALDATGELIPQALVESLKRNKIALKGPIGTPIAKGFRSVNVALRKQFDLYINLRPVRLLPGVTARYDNVNVVLFRENTEGLYAGLEIYDEARQIADAINRISYVGSRRISKAAFEYARANGRKKVTLFHKANILKLANGLLLNTFREVAQEYPDIEAEDMIIDAGFMNIVMRPERFDIIVTTNMFGDILSDLLAGMVGGLGVVAGANIGDEYAIFEAVHGTAPDIAGKDMANPTSVLLAALDMLRYIDLAEYATTIEQALLATLKDKPSCTKDLGGQAGTFAFAEAVVNQLQKTQTTQTLTV